MKNLQLKSIMFFISMSVVAQQPVPVHIDRQINGRQSVRNTDRASEQSDKLNSAKVFRKQNTVLIKMSAKLKQKLKISETEKTKFSDLLVDKKIRLTKVWNNTCGDKIFDVSNENCRGKEEFWLASGYSFYTRDYNFYYSHFLLNNSQIIAPSREGLIQLLTNIGDISLNLIDKKHLKVKILEDYEEKENDVQKTVKKIKNGFRINELLINDKFKIGINQTYLLRSVFIDYISIGSKVDKIYALRFVEEDDGFFTIAWKEIK